MNIGAIMKKYGVSQRALAEKLNVKSPTISQYRKGNPTVGTLKLLADAIGCDRWEFFQDEIPQGKSPRVSPVKRRNALADFTAQQLVDELTSRGFEGEIRRTEVFSFGNSNNEKD